MARIAESEERKLFKEGRMEEFNTLFKKLQELGAIKEITVHELRSWSVPVHYVSLQHVIDESSATTSFRIVTNSSLKPPEQSEPIIITIYRIVIILHYHIVSNTES